MDKYRNPYDKCKFDVRERGEEEAERVRKKRKGKGGRRKGEGKRREEKTRGGKRRVADM